MIFSHCSIEYFNDQIRAVIDVCSTGLTQGETAGNGKGAVSRMEERRSESMRNLMGAPLRSARLKNRTVVPRLVRNIS